MKIAVVGSGPSAAAALDQIRKFPNIELHHVDTSQNSDDGIPLSDSEKQKLTKMYFESDYPYRRSPFATTLSQYETNVPRSFAFGGLSLVWGATMLPYVQEDCSQWVVTPFTLKKDYLAVSNFAWVSGEKSQYLAEYSDFGMVGYLPSSKRFQKILSSKSSESLGIVPSRIAVKAASPGTAGCINCGQCLVGCSYGYIWNSAEFILRNHSRGILKHNAYLDTVKETEDGVELNICSLDEGQTALTGFDKVFIACGVVETFRILAKSNLVGRCAELSDSAIAYVPFLSFIRGVNVKEEIHSLTQLAVRLKHELPGRPAHLQMYEIGPEVDAHMIKTIPFLRCVPSWIRMRLLKSFVIGIFYLPSELSPGISLNLTSNQEIEIKLNQNQISDTQRKMFTGKILSTNLLKFLKVGLLPISFAVVHKAAGSGVHTGSSMPMGRITDVLGRLQPDSRIHIIDASCLPDIPAGPITYTVMANASRISREALS